MADSEGGLYLRPRDLAKIAYLFLKDGRWEGQTVVEPGWVEDSVAPSATVADGVRYGFKWWLVRLQAAVRVRFPLVPGVNDDAAHVRRLAEVVASLGFREIDVVPYRRAVPALRALGRPNPSASLQEPPADAIAEVLQRLSECGLTARVVPRRCSILASLVRRASCLTGKILAFPETAVPGNTCLSRRRSAAVVGRVRHEGRRRWRYSPTAAL